MAFGIDQAGKAAVDEVVAQLPGIEKFTDDERAQLTAGIAKIAADFVSQAGAQVLKLEEPVLKRIDTLNENTVRLLTFAEKFAAFSNGFSVIPITASKPDAETPPASV